MKNLKAFTLLLLALLLGAGAAVYAAFWVARQKSGAATQVVVAAVDIELGRKLGASMLTTVDWPQGAVPAGAFRTPEDLQDRVLKVGVLKGDAIVERKLAPAGTQGGLASVIAEGKRAMTVRVNDVVGVAGFALPGTYVDVMVNTQKNGAGAGGDNQISKTVLEQVLVLAVAQEAGRDDTKPKVVSAVTLELTPQEAEKLDLARSVGTLSLVLRNPSDPVRTATTGATKNELLGMAQPPAVEAPPVKPAAPPRAPKPLAQRPPATASTAELKLADAGAAPPAAPATPARPCVEIVRGLTKVTECF